MLDQGMQLVARGVRDRAVDGSRMHEQRGGGQPVIVILEAAGMLVALA
jgi:hypothetical protein